jgi:hypothetical protein
MTWVKRHPGASGLWLGVVLALSAGAAAGCRSSPAPEEVDPTPSASTRMVSSGASGPEAAILADYRAYWKDFETAGRTAAWNSPQLAEHATGPLLAQSRLTLRSMRQRGLVARGSVKVDPRLLSSDATRATVYDCNDTSRYLAYDARTGQPKGTSSGRPHGMTVQLMLEGGTWKAASILKEEAGRCSA